MAIIQSQQTISLDYHHTNYIDIKAKQYNSGEYLRIYVTDNGAPVFITNEMIVEVRIRDAKGTCFRLATNDTYLKVNPKDVPNAIEVITESMANEITEAGCSVKVGDYVIGGTKTLFTRQEDGSILIHLPQSIFQHAGKAEGEITLTIDNAESTMNLIILIEKAVCDRDELVKEAFTTDEVTQIRAELKAFTARAEIAAGNASKSETNAKTSETNAKTSETKAKTSETNAKTSETNAKTSETKAKTSETNAKTSETNAKDYSLKAESYAVGTAKKDDGSDYRTGQKTDNSKYWYEQTKNVASSLSGALKPMGTIVFANLPTITISSTTKLPDQTGWMYNISNKFTSDSRFEDGGNIKYGEGSNVYCTANGEWDVLASASAGGGIMVSNTEPLQNENSLWLKPY